MAEDSGHGSREGRVPPEANWTSEHEMSEWREIKRQREEAEPYNEPAARRRAREMGKEEARRNSFSDHSRASTKAPPRGLVIEGSSSSEFVSAAEEAYTDVLHSDGEQQAHVDSKAVPTTSKKRRKRRRRHEKSDAPVSNERKEVQTSQEQESAPRRKRRWKRPRPWARKQRREPASVEVGA